MQDYAARGRSNLALTANETTTAGLASNAAGLATIGTTYVRGRSGIYAQADRVVEGSAATGRRGTAIFSAIEYSDPQTSLVSTFFEIGAVRHGTLQNRPSDTVAVAFATQNYNVRLRRLEGRLQALGYAIPRPVPTKCWKSVTACKPRRGSCFGPGLQYVFTPGGIAAMPSVHVFKTPADALVIGLGGYVSF